MSNVFHIDRTTGGITLNGLSASRLLSTDASKVVSSTDLNSWVTGTANQVVVADDLDGTITLSTPQDIDTTASPTFAGLSLTGGFYPRTLDQSAEPAAGTGATQCDTAEAVIWTDTDDAKCYLCYNHGGTVKTIELT